MATLDIRSVSKSFGATHVLKDINLSIDDGEFLVLVGPSGCGKSTLLNIVAGLLDLTRGTMMIDDVDVTSLEPKERDIAMVFQSYALYPSMTVERNIDFSLRMRKVPEAERAAKVREVAELLQIEPLLHRKPQALSGGQRQRVAMGRALVRNPKIFLFDEPLSNLDAKLRVDMRHEIKKLHQRLATTIVYVTHDQVEAMTMATRIAVMKDGEVQQFGTPDDIYQRPSNTFVATFMGSPPMNLLSGKVNGGGRTVTLAGGTEMPVPETAPPLDDGRSVHVGLRPEWFTPLGPGEDGPGALQVTVDVLEPTGPDIYASLHYGGEDLMARIAAGTSLTPGETRGFRIALDKAVLFDAESGAALYG